MKWKMNIPTNTRNTYWSSGDYVIDRAVYHGCGIIDYVVWRGDEHVGTYINLAEAKSAAGDHARGTK